MIIKCLYNYTPKKVYKKFTLSKINNMLLQIKNTEHEDDYVEAEQDKNKTWEANHTVITRVMAKLIRQNERMPSKAEIADETGLSRQTIHKHLKQFGHESLVVEQLEQFNFMSSKVLAKIMELSMDGDIRAARLALEIMGIINPSRNNIAGLKNQSTLENENAT